MLVEFESLLTVTNSSAESRNTTYLQVTDLVGGVNDDAKQGTTDKFQDV